ncbi:MFS transporter [Paenibacillus sp. N10]|uniref:MFS transporter n=1 Tax=Paenibacillus lutrae TaxID=2078573 RepID=A0A7X3FFE5_9BACL|nr:MFS transporter [Paenibacillus lutrae]
MIYWIICLIAFVFQIMLNMTRPILALYAVDLGADAFRIGTLTAAYAFLPLLFAIHAGKIADRIGDKIPVMAGITGTMAGLLLPFLFPAIPVLYVSQLLVGVSHIFINISLQNVLGNSASKENRDRYFSRFSMAVAAGGFIGPLAGGYLAEHISYTAVFLTAATAGIIPAVLSGFIPVIIRSLKPGGEKRAEPFAAFKLLRQPLLRKALASSALVLYSRDVFVAYFPLLAVGAGLKESEIGWVIAVQGLAMVAVRFFLVKLTALAGRETVLFGSVMTAGASFLLLPFADHLAVFMLLSACMGFGLGCGQPLSMTTIYNASPKNRTGEVLGMRIASNRLSQLVAPLLFGTVGAASGLLSIFLLSGLFLIGGAVVTRVPPGQGDP